METHTFYLTENPQTFELKNEINNIKGDKVVRVKNIQFEAEYLYVAQDTDIQWDTNLDRNEKRRKETALKLILTGMKEPIYALLAPSLAQPLPESQRGSIVVSTGYYGIDWFDFILNAIPGVSFKVHSESKRVTLTITDPNLKLRLNREVANLLNLPENKLSPNVIYIGEYNSTPTFIHCQQLDHSINFYNGKSSNLLGVIPYESTNKTPKKLLSRNISELTFSLRNERDELLNNVGKILIELDAY